MFTAYQEWLGTLKYELQLVKDIARNLKSDSAIAENLTVVQQRRERLNRAQTRTEDWFVEWLTDSFKATLPYTKTSERTYSRRSFYATCVWISVPCD